MPSARRVLATLAPAMLSIVPLAGCDPDPTPPPITTDVGLERAWTSETFAGCVLASPLAYEASAGAQAIVASGDGRVVALDPATGATAWSVALPHEDGRMAHVIATPAIVGGADRLVVAWQDVPADAVDPAAAPRTAHHVALIDLARGALDEAFPVLTLAGSAPSADGTGEVRFAPGNALSRSRLVHVPAELAGGGRALGLAYVSFGNARDIQPWHGWVFELDLDAWRDGGEGAAISSLLLTTPSTSCGTPGESGSDDMICGGGVWAPAGPVLVPTPGGDARFELLVPTGNGALDLTTRSYANTLMRVRGPGLAFDPGCDAAACAGFDVLAPSPDCLASCRDLFVPRLRAEDAPFDAPGCEGLPFFACYAALDWDLGADSPALVALRDPASGGPGPRVIVLPAKDGGVYLFDADHLGTLYDRLQLVAACGAGGARCEASWAGMMVTQPKLAEVEGEALAVIATFVPDDAHPAGLVGVRVTMREGTPRLERAWEAPSFASDDARRGFRRHPSGVRLLRFAGEGYAAVVDQGRLGLVDGVLYVVRLADGAIAARAALDGPGQRYAEPLEVGGRLLVPSCDQGNAGPGRVEAWDLRRASGS